MIRHGAWIAVAIVGLGCGHPTPRAADPASEQDQALLLKLQGYVACIADQVPPVFAIADGYRARLGGQPATADTPLLVRPIEDPATCAVAIVQAQFLPPHPQALEASAMTFAHALATVAAVTREAAANTNRAQRLELHARLAAAFTAFDTAERALFDDVERANLVLRKAQLARREAKSGRSLAVIADDMIVHAEELVHAAATPADHLDQLAVPELTTQLAAFEASMQEMSAYAAGHPTEVDGGLKDIAILTDHATALLVAGRQLRNRARDHVEYSATEKLMMISNNEGAVIGTPAALTDAYNHLLDVYSP